MTTSRKVHVGSAAAVLILGLVTVIAAPGLWKDTATGFATVGGLLTLYGVIFAVIETWRARSASEQAKQAAITASNRITSLYDLKNIAECQTYIGLAFKDLEREGWTSISVLSRINELYIAEFHGEYAQSDSAQRHNAASLQSHAATTSGPLAGRALSRLKSTLLSMQADLTAAAGGKISENKSQ